MLANASERGEGGPSLVHAGLLSLLRLIINVSCATSLLPEDADEVADDSLQLLSYCAV